MALTSPGVEVTIIDQSQYLPGGSTSVPLVVLATAQNKADPNGIGVAAATTAANANKLYQVTSQRDLVTLYGNPFFYTSTNGTPIQGYELNEYGLLAAYSLLGVSNRCYVLRADIDLASLVGQTGRPTGAPDNNTYWLDTTTSTWGIYEFNDVTQSFELQSPIVITDTVNLLAGFPLNSIGNIGDYAVNAIQTTSFPGNPITRQYFKKSNANQWVALGTEDWLADTPTVISTASNPSLVAGTFTIQMNSQGGSATVTITISGGQTVNNVATTINNLGYLNLAAGVRSGKLCIFSTAPSLTPNQQNSIAIASSTAGLLTALGIPAGTYYQPTFVFGTAAQQPLWTTGQTYPAPTGAVWIKVNGTGLLPSVSVYNTALGVWQNKEVTLATSDYDATAVLDSTGGQAIPANTIYAQYEFNENYNLGPVYIWKRYATGATVITGDETSPVFTNGPYTIRVYVSQPNSIAQLGPYIVTIADNDDATDFVTAWAAANIPYTTAEVTTDEAIQITHVLGGDIAISDYSLSTGISNGFLTEAGFVAGVTPGVKYGSSDLFSYPGVAFDSTTGVGIDLTINVTTRYNTYYVDPNTFGDPGSGFVVGDQVTFLGTDLGGASPANDLVCEVVSVTAGAVTGLAIVSGTAANAYYIRLSNWREFTYTANEGTPVAEPANNTNWFYSVVDEVDIMVNTSTGWKGYGNVDYDSNGFPLPSGTNVTDPNGPIVSASEPTTQSDGTALEYGDIWISTSNLEDYPVIYRWQSVDTVDQWVLIDNTDQTTATGVLFADARWATNGTTSVTDDPIPTIVSLLDSNYLDLDAPDDSLYPVGMLLFNTRRSGYNVKQFRSNYFNNTNFPGESLPTETNAWVSVSGLQSNGSPYMGRKAQRAMVVASLRSAIDTNVEIRDEDNFFNLIASPNYPEMQPNMVVLNNDRGQTGYIIGDTPMGLADSATDIQAWATNAAGATSTGESGCVTRDTYLGLFYPSGIAFDLSGNEVAVPSSHMMLRTFLRNDTIAYPWLAAAGTRRGIIDNAASIGYLNRTTGEFQVIKTRLGIRDVLYLNFINPMVFFTGNGLLNYGNKTSFDSQSALDRTNVARLVAYIRRQLTIAARPFVFEPNDPLTRQQIAGVVETLMIDLVAKRGLYDYLVVCDESNNTPARIDRNELWVDVAVEPVKAAEFIYIPVRILNTGELSGA